MNKDIWYGDVGGYDVRIRQVAKDDCVVEFRKVRLDGIWTVANDDAFCARVYMTAFLDLRNYPLGI